MKKITLSSLIAFSLLLGATSASAEDNTALTKAVVKIIKNQRLMNENIASLNSNQANNDSKLSDMSEKISLSNTEIENTKKEIDTIKAIDSTQNAKLTAIEELVHKINANLNETSKKSVELESHLKNVSAETNQAKAGNIQGIKASNEVIALNSQVNELKTELEQIKAVFKEQIEALKVVTTAELDMVKARIERSKPIYVIEDAPSGCKSGKCDSDENSDQIINEFLKN